MGDEDPDRVVGSRRGKSLVLGEYIGDWIFSSGGPLSSSCGLNIVLCITLVILQAFLVGPVDGRVVLASDDYMNNSLVTDSEQQRCDMVYEVDDPSEWCTYVKEHCMSESESLRMVVLYYCAGDGLLGTIIVKPLVILWSIILLVALFKWMGMTAESYLSIILSQISQDMGLPPRLAGVSLLALGNGAPDLSSSIAAIQTGNFHLAMGSLIGSVMFVGCVVAGRLISLSGGMRSRAAQIRDVLALCLAVAAVALFGVLGTMTYASVCVLLAMYVLYVLIVAVADVTKKRYGIDWTGLLRLRSDASSLENSASFKDRVRSALLPQTMDENTGQYESLPEEDIGANMGSNASSEVEMADSPRKPGPVGERSTWAVGNHQDDTPNHQGTSRVTWSSGVARSMSEPPVSPRKGNAQDFIHMSTTEYRARALADMSDKHYEGRMLRDAEEVQAEGLERMLETICEDAREDFISESSDIEDAVEVSRQRRDTHSSARQDQQQQQREDEALHVGQGMKHALWQMWSFVSRTSDTLVVPFEILLRLTIPIAGESFNKDVFTRACGLSPLWATLYLTSFSPAWWHILLAVGVGGILASLAWYGTNGQDSTGDTDTPPWVYGDSFPVIAILIAVYGFAVAGMWIDAIAGELVGVIHVFGIICQIKPSILGLTVLAWGNSLTDLVANMSVAMQSTGGASMAMTACFAGPLFNLLLGIGVGFILFFTDTGKTSVAVEFDSIVFVGCIFAMVFCIGIIAISIINGQRLPGWSGWLLMSWYGLYMVVIVAIALVLS